MAFNPAIPQPGDLLSNSQGDLLANNAALDASFSVNHLPFSDASANNGKHTFVELLQQSAKPTTAALEGTLYTKDDTTPTNRTQLFYIGDAGGAGIEYQLTKCIDAQIASFGNKILTSAGHFSGWTFLPGGLIMFYGSVNTPGTTGSVAYNFGFPSGTGAFSITLSVLSAAATTFRYKFKNSSATGFNYDIDNAPTDLTWMAIGK